MRQHCKTDSKILCRFLNLCSGNWHNCVYVRCNCGRRTSCYSSDFLFLPDQDGKPILLPLADCSLIFSILPVSDECLISISFSQFEKFYAAYINTLQLPLGDCAACYIQDALVKSNYNW